MQEKWRSGWVTCALGQEGAGRASARLSNHTVSLTVGEGVRTPFGLVLELDYCGDPPFLEGKGVSISPTAP